MNQKCLYSSPTLIYLAFGVNELQSRGAADHSRCKPQDATMVLCYALGKDHERALKPGGGMLHRLKGSQTNMMLDRRWMCGIAVEPRWNGGKCGAYPIWKQRQERMLLVSENSIRNMWS